MAKAYEEEHHHEPTAALPKTALVIFFNKYNPFKVS